MILVTGRTNGLAATMPHEVLHGPVLTIPAADALAIASATAAALHVPQNPGSAEPWCAECGRQWPCRTAEVLGA